MAAIPAIAQSVAGFVDTDAFRTLDADTTRHQWEAQPFTPTMPRPRQAIADDVVARAVPAAARQAAVKLVQSPESNHYHLVWSRQVPLDDCHPFNGFACIPLPKKRRRQSSKEGPAGWLHFPGIVWCCLNKHYYNGQMVGLTVVSADRWPAELSLELRLPITSVYSADWFASTWSSCEAESQHVAVAKFELSWLSRTTARTTSTIRDMLQMDPGYMEPKRSSKKPAVDVDEIFGAGDEQDLRDDVCDIESALEKIMEEAARTLDISHSNIRNNEHPTRRVVRATSVIQTWNRQ